MSAALEEESQGTSEARINRALRIQVSPAARMLILPGDKVRIYREDTRRWEGPFTTTRIVRKQVWVPDEKAAKSFPLSAVLPAATTA